MELLPPRDRFSQEDFWGGTPAAVACQRLGCQGGVGRSNKENLAKRHGMPHSNGAR